MNFMQQFGILQVSVLSSSEHYNISRIKLDEVYYLAAFWVQLVVGRDEWVWVVDSASIIGVQVREGCLSAQTEQTEL
ncbi:hypothetical protein OIU77_007664 [Salix suchowensis]|uniref:Uncharacterized protein n=1 Tax=Salix suchowensis TaxID=1278906 RepID=A0ABQ9AH35_9ROSI|nr:hypothetical protein OIU77_007664 [Salix suchowensis]